MTVRVHVTEMMVRHLGTSSEFTVDAKNLEELLDETERKHPGFRDSVCDESGKIRTYVNVFVNGEILGREAGDLRVPLRDGDEVHILASVAGGTR